MMASSSGTSSMSTKEEDLQVLMEQRKKKRKQSNRESARRSRMRRQQHVDDLIAQVERLKRENSIIMAKVNVTTQHYLKVEAQNLILRAQKTELTQTLQSLNDITYLINSTTTDHYNYYDTNNNYYYYDNNNFINTMHMAYVNQPIVAAADMFQW
uniref:Ocs element-binding factor 1 n=2 Tax=Cajanus cajan TaxID=3821 RepID=A0A151RMC2_CAJCA|nr:Ocs element-binding factor 1 [Cajanus cajan]